MHVRYPVSWTQPLNLIYSIYDVYVFRDVWFTWSAYAFVVSIFRYILSNLQPFDHWICWNNHNVISLYWSTMFQAHLYVCFDWPKTLVLNANSIFMSKFSILIAKKKESTLGKQHQLSWIRFSWDYFLFASHSCTNIESLCVLFSYSILIASFLFLLK